MLVHPDLQISQKCRFLANDSQDWELRNENYAKMAIFVRKF